MILVAFILMTIVSVILGAFYTLTKWDSKWQNILVKCLALLSCLALALTSANLNSAYGAYTLLISLGMAVLICFEAFKCTTAGKASVYILPSANLVALLLFLCAGVSQTNFSLWALLSGLFFGAGIAFIVKIVKKDFTWQTNLMISFNLSLLLAFFMQSVAVILTTKTIVPAILYLFSALFMSVHTLLEIFATKNKTTTIISNILRILSLLILSASIYFV